MPALSLYIRGRRFSPPAPHGKNNTAANHDLTFMDLVDSMQKENKTAAKKTGEKQVVKNGPQAEHGKDVKKVAVGP